MDNFESTSLPTCEDWFAELTKPEVSDTDFDRDVPLELLPTMQVRERIWPRIFPGL
jgi:hypothetical protein